MNIDTPSPLRRQPPHFLDLPDDIVAHIMCIGLSRPGDVVMMAATCRRVRRIARTAALRLSLHEGLEVKVISEALTALCRSFPGIEELDMTSLPLSDAALHDSGLHFRCPGITGLQLAGCKKLSSQAITFLVHNLPQLGFLGVQRCFQLNVGALNAVLAASTWECSKLSTALFSHLDLGPLFLGDTTRVDSYTQVKLRILALHNCYSIHAASLRSLVASCPKLEMLMLGGTTVAPSREHPNDTPIWPLEEVCDCFSNALSSLKVLELTFWPVEVIKRVRSTIKPSHRVWDFRSLESVTQAARYMSSRYAVEEEEEEEEEEEYFLISSSSVCDVAQAIRSATRCCGGGRASPLHSAAEEGDAALADVLITLGADVSGRDTRGNTPLFTACEAGHAKVVARLLMAGSNPLTLNASGEGPLYIAALRGHDAVVQILLNHCHTCGIQWENGNLYGDGWTPLHAAIIGNHLKVAVRLLEAAGAAGPHRKENLKALLHAQNRYGQTCLHIAARKSNFDAVNMLLQAGGVALLNRVDSDGRTAIDVARQNDNHAALQALQQCRGHIISKERVWSPTGGGGRQRHQTKPGQGLEEVAKGRRCRESTDTGFKWVGRRLQDRRRQLVGP